MSRTGEYVRLYVIALQILPMAQGFNKIFPDSLQTACFESRCWAIIFSAYDALNRMTNYWKHQTAPYIRLTDFVDPERL